MIMTDHLPKWTLTTLAAAAILWLTLAPHPLPEIDMPLFPHADKVVHALMMGGLLWAWALDIMRLHRAWIRPPRRLILATIAVILFGGAIELAQLVMHAGRGAEWPDFAADAAGAIAAMLTLHLLPASR